MNYKIMIVEDDPDIAELVSGHLGKFGFTIEANIDFYRYPICRLPVYEITKIDCESLAT